AQFIFVDARLACQANLDKIRMAHARARRSRWNQFGFGVVRTRAGPRRPTIGSFNAGSKGLRPNVSPSTFTSRPSMPLAVNPSTPKSDSCTPLPLGADPINLSPV